MVVYANLNNIKDAIIEVSHTAGEREDGSDDVTIQTECSFIDDHKRYLCCICHLLMKMPRRITTCGHSFCDSCLMPQLKRMSEWECPTCRFPTRESAVIIDTKEAHKMNSLRVRCLNHERGCNDISVLRDLQDHMLACPHSPVMCQWRCSNEPKFTRHNLAEHLTECPKQPVQCTVCLQMVPLDTLDRHEDRCRATPITCSHCQDIVTQSEYEEHIQNRCNKQIVDCPYAAIGCSERMTRDRLAHHEQTAMAQHLQLMFAKMNNAENLRNRTHPAEVASNRMSGDQSDQSLEEQILMARRKNMSEISTLIEEIQVKIKSVENDLSKLKVWRDNAQSLMQDMLLKKQQNLVSQSQLEDLDKKVMLLNKCVTDRINEKERDLMRYTDNRTDVVYNKNERHLLKLEEELSGRLVKLRQDMDQSIRECQAAVKQNDLKTPIMSDQLESQLKYLYEHINVGGIYWELSCSDEEILTLEQEGNSTMLSGCFFSHHRGYKLQITANFCGDKLQLDDVETTHWTKLNLSVDVVAGEYDHTLMKPLSGTITVGVIEKINDKFLLDHKLEFLDVDTYNTQLFSGGILVEIKLLRERDLVILCQISDAMSRLPSDEWFKMVDDVCLKRIEATNTEINTKLGKDVSLESVEAENMGSIAGFSMSEEIDQEAVTDSVEKTEDDGVVSEETSIEKRLNDIERTMHSVSTSCKGAVSVYRYIKTEVNTINESLERLNKVESRLDNIDTEKTKMKLRHRYRVIEEKLNETQHMYNITKSTMAEIKTECTAFRTEINELQKKMVGIAASEGGGDVKGDNLNIRYVDTRDNHSNDPKRMESSDIRLRHGSGNATDINAIIAAAEQFDEKKTPGGSTMKKLDLAQCLSRHTGRELERDDGRRNSLTRDTMSRVEHWVNSTNLSGSDNQINQSSNNP